MINIFKWIAFGVVLITGVFIGIKMDPSAQEDIKEWVNGSKPCERPFPYKYEIGTQSVLLKGVNDARWDKQTFQDMELGMRKKLDIWTSPYSGDIYEVLDIRDGVATIKFYESHDIGTTGHCRYVISN